MAEFSADHRWWWTGEAWEPATSPDGSIVRWDGFRWVRKQELSVELRILLAIGLLLADVIYAAGVLFILLIGASDVSGTDVLVKFLLLLGIAIGQGASAAILSRLFRRAWWALSLLATWPFSTLLVLVAVNPDASMWESVLLLALAILVTVGIGWLAAFGTPGQFRVTADGQWWGRPDEWYSTLSADGTWRWVSDEWRREPVAVAPAVLAIEDWEALASNQSGQVTWPQLARRVAGFGWDVLSAPWRFGWSIVRDSWVGWLFALPIVAIAVFALLLISGFTIVVIVIAALIVAVDSRMGIEPFEGDLSGVTGETLRLREPPIKLRCPGRVRSNLVEGAQYRIYRTRLTGYLANFERINTETAAGLAIGVSGSS